jgi:hypothetical protein
MLVRSINICLPATKAVADEGYGIFSNSILSLSKIGLFVLNAFSGD